jgi:hypothetical protein
MGKDVKIDLQSELKHFIQDLYLGRKTCYREGMPGIILSGHNDKRLRNLDAERNVGLGRNNGSNMGQRMGKEGCNDARGRRIGEVGVE